MSQELNPVEVVHCPKYDLNTADGLRICATQCVLKRRIYADGTDALDPKLEARIYNEWRECSLIEGVVVCLGEPIAYSIQAL